MPSSDRLRTLLTHRKERAALIRAIPRALPVSIGAALRGECARPEQRFSAWANTILQTLGKTPLEPREAARVVHKVMQDAIAHYGGWQNIDQFPGLQAISGFQVVQKHPGAFQLTPVRPDLLLRLDQTAVMHAFGREFCISHMGGWVFGEDGDACYRFFPVTGPDAGAKARFLEEQGVFGRTYLVCKKKEIEGEDSFEQEEARRAPLIQEFLEEEEDEDDILKEPDDEKAMAKFREREKRRAPMIEKFLQRMQQARLNAPKEEELIQRMQNVSLARVKKKDFPLTLSNQPYSSSSSSSTSSWETIDA